jgi:hypothetical protein
MELFMRISIEILTVLCLGAVFQAIASEPPASSPAAASESAAAPTATPDAHASTTTTTANGARTTTANTEAGTKTVNLVAGDAAADAKLKKLKAMGYKAEMHGNEVVFCRNEAQLGSRFKHKVCNTAEVLDKQMLDSQDLTKQAQRNLSNGLKGN